MFNILKKILLITLISFGVAQFVFAMEVKNQVNTQATTKKCDTAHHCYHKPTAKESSRVDSKSTTQQICLPPDCGVKKM